MKKRILSFLTMLCMVATLLPANIITVSAYDGMQYGNYLYYKVNDYGEVGITDCDESVTDVIIPAEIDNKRVIAIDNSAFSNCSSLTSIDIPNSVTYIGESAFAHCSSLKSITLPSSITYIWDLTFCCCSSLTSIDIPDSVTYIGESAFCGCSSLTSITIPNSVEHIDSVEFCDCTGLKTVYYKGTAEDWSHIVYISPYDDILTNTEIIYLKCTKTTVSDNGKDFTVIPKNIESGVTVILVLYNGNQLVEAQSAAYTGDDIPFTTDKTYTNARVMVWNDFDDITPICEAEIVKLNI